MIYFPFPFPGLNCCFGGENMTKEEKKKGFKRIKKGGRRRQKLAAALNYISTGDDWICSAAKKYIYSVQFIV